MSIAILSLSGLATSAVMKYADNLIKVFALAGSMIFTTVASALLFHTVVTTNFLLGTTLACGACFLYFSEQSNSTLGACRVVVVWRIQSVVRQSIHAYRPPRRRCIRLQWAAGQSPSVQ
jgi:hypothetical protein